VHSLTVSCPNAVHILRAACFAFVPSLCS
jgi:hypothetical protein